MEMAQSSGESIRLCVQRAEMRHYADCSDNSGSNRGVAVLNKHVLLSWGVLLVTRFLTRFCRKRTPFSSLSDSLYLFSLLHTRLLFRRAVIQRAFYRACCGFHSIGEYHYSLSQALHARLGTDMHFVAVGVSLFSTIPHLRSNTHIVSTHWSLQVLTTNIRWPYSFVITCAVYK